MDKIVLNNKSDIVDHFKIKDLIEEYDHDDVAEAIKGNGFSNYFSDADVIEICRPDDLLDAMDFDDIDDWMDDEVKRDLARQLDDQDVLSCLEESSIEDKYADILKLSNKPQDVLWKLLCNQFDVAYTSCKYEVIQKLCKLMDVDVNCLSNE